MGHSLTLGVLTFNQAIYVEKMIASIAGQTNSDFSIVILDNASADSCFDVICESIAKFGLTDRTRIYRNLENSGSAAGLRRILEESKSDFLAVAHGDDELHPDYIRAIKMGLNRFPDATALNVNLQGFSSDETGERLNVRLYRPLWTKSNFLNSWLVSGLNPGLMPGAVLKVDFVLKHQLLAFSEPINGVEDALLWMRILRKGGSIRTISSPVYMYRLHEGQFSSNLIKNAYFFGLARRVNIEESPSLIHSLIARSEINYELQLFGMNSEYKKGLGDWLNQNKVWNFLRFKNVMLRRLIISLRLNIYK